MNGASCLLPGLEDERRSREHSQFYTPPWLAERVAQWCLLFPHNRVLEPAAGRGALITALDTQAAKGPYPHLLNIEAWDIDPVNWQALYQLDLNPVTRLRVTCGNFLGVPEGECASSAAFDFALMNPPYEYNQDVDFITRALDYCPKVIGIFQSRIVHSAGRAEFWRWTDIRRLAFLSDRPHFGGPHSAKTDFIVLDVVRRKHRRKQGEASAGSIEWWSR